MGEKRLVIHAGSHKTGSSAIQRYLFENQRQLEGVTYLHRDKANASLWMLQAFKHDIAELPAFRHRQLDKAKIAFLRRRARALLAEQAEHAVTPLSILSAEAIGTFDAEEQRELREFLLPFYGQVTLCQYFRPLKARMESAFQEKLKHSSTDLEQPFRLAYCRIIERQDGVFGRDNVHCYRYDVADFPEGNVVLHFLSECGIDARQPVGSEVVNTGLSLAATQLLYIYRRFHPTLAEGDRQLVRRLAGLSGCPLRFHSELYEKLIRIHPGEVESFEQRTGFSVAENLAADDDIAVRCDEDLLVVPDSSIEWLQSQLAISAPVQRTDVEGIANLVAALGRQSKRLP